MGGVSNRRLAPTINATVFVIGWVLRGSSLTAMGIYIGKAVKKSPESIETRRGRPFSLKEEDTTMPFAFVIVFLFKASSDIL